MRALQPVGDEHFDSYRAWRTDAVMLAITLVSACASAFSLDLEYRRAGVTDQFTLLILLLSVIGTGVVCCWAVHVRVALGQILAGKTGPIPSSWMQLRALSQLARDPLAMRNLAPNKVPLAWHSPLATTLWRLRLALLVLLGIFSWSIFNTGAAVATHVLAWAPIVVLAFGTFIALCTFAPFILVDNARRRFREADIESLLKPSTPTRPIRIVSLIVGIALLLLSVVQLAEWAIPLVEDSTRLVGRATTSVELPRSTQTIYAGCDGDLNCSPLDPSDIKVTSTTTHTTLEIVDDQGVDHQSFEDHPWLSVANVRVAVTGRYLVTLGGTASGQYRIALSQSTIFQIVLPLIGTVVWRVIALWLTGVAIYETFYFRRPRKRKT